MENNQPLKPAEPVYSQLFSGTASFYARYRPSYPPRLVDHLVRSFHIDMHARVLDVGCGTGQLTLPLASHAETVVGLDPEPEMLDEAMRSAERLQLHNVVWLAGDDTSMPGIALPFAPFRVAVFARSFHWTDRERVLRSLDTLVEADGGVAIVGDSGPPGEDKKALWWSEVEATVTDSLGPRRRAGGGYYQHPSERFEVTLARSPFSQVEHFGMVDRRTWSVDEIVGFLYSTSYCSQRLLGSNRPGFEEDLRRRLQPVGVRGAFVEEVPVHALLARRPFP